MKHLFISAMMLGCVGAMSAQLLNVAGVQRVNIPSSLSTDQAVISPDGLSVVVSSNTDRSLRKIDLASLNTSTVADNASIVGLQFTADSRDIVYRQSTTNKQHLRYTSVQSTDLTSGQTKTIVKPTRHLGGFAVIGKDVMTVDNMKYAATSLDGSKAAKAPVASIYYGQLMVTVNGKTTAINPNGKDGQSYLWPSVSPDGAKVVYYLAAHGCYVCDIDGSNPTWLGGIRAPRWLDNSTIIGMRDIDNGEIVTSSSIIAASLDGVEQTLTDSDVIAMFPSASADGSKIAFTTPTGDLYIMNINR